MWARRRNGSISRRTGLSWSVSIARACRLVAVVRTRLTSSGPGTGGTPGQHVHQETSDELVRVNPHRLPPARAANAIVLPAERNRAVVGCNEAAVRDGDAMGVTGEIAQHLLGPCERCLAIDNPLDAPQRSDESLERSLVGKSGKGVEECQLIGVVRGHEHRQHLAAE